MTGLGYVKPDEVAGIPVMSESYAYVTYGPLADAKCPVSVVLVVADANRSLTLTEAVARVDGGAPPAMGRPACALVPQVANSGAAAASLGCCGARACMDSLTDGIVLWGFPGERLQAYVEAIEVLAKVNTALSKFHTERRRSRTHSTRWGQGERNGTPSGPIFGLAVSQGEERTCCSTHHHVARTANGFDISRRHCAQR